MHTLFSTIFFFAVLFGIASSQTQIACNPGCVPPTMCDTNTGICRFFRTAFNGPVTIGCPACPSGTSCDTNTGICRTFRIP